MAWFRLKTIDFFCLLSTHLHPAHKEGAVPRSGEEMPPVRREGDRRYRPAVQAHLRRGFRASTMLKCFPRKHPLHRARTSAGLEPGKRSKRQRESRVSTCWGLNVLNQSYRDHLRVLFTTRFWGGCGTPSPRPGWSREEERFPRALYNLVPHLCSADLRACRCVGLTVLPALLLALQMVHSA